MQTRYFKIESETDAVQISEAAEILRHGGLLALPTETVYGLGADGLNEDAVRRIFEAKGRPQDNPLILHIPSADWLPRCCVDVPEAAYRLAEAFWPGPLTMVLRKAPLVPLRTTGGLDTVGVRCPDHAVARAIIAAANVPVAAPSANLSGRPSATSIAHVRADLDGKIDGAVDGGDCAVGVESTIVDLTATPPRLLRPGGLPLEQLEAVLGEIVSDGALIRPLAPQETPRAPGMKYRHYAPKAPVTVVSGSRSESGRWLRANIPDGVGLILFDECAPLFPDHMVRRIGSVKDKDEQARRVFDALRFFDSTDVSEIYAQCPDEDGLGLAVGNRLKKAAGFRVVDACDGKRVVGFTGGTGAGKTTLLHAFSECGAQVFDCDAYYYEQLGCDVALRAALDAVFPGVLRDGELDRARLGAQVFTDPSRLAELDAIVRAHLPCAIARAIGENDAQLVGIDAVKLFESGLASLCDITVAVTAPEELRVRRIMARDGMTETAAHMRVRAQKEQRSFVEACDLTFDNPFADRAAAEAAARQFVRRLCEFNYGSKTDGLL